MSTAIATKQKNSFIIPLIIIGAFFFIFGFTTWANSQLIPYFKIACELSNSQALLVATAFFAAYFVMALPSSYILDKIGYKKGMILGLLVMAGGALLFIPAAQSRSYPSFLVALFVIGTGLALLQTASNPYVTILGPIESAAQRISIMGICNKLAGIVAVVVMGGIVLKNVDAFKIHLATLAPAEKVHELDELAKRVINPYITIAIILVAFSILLAFLHLPEVKQEEESETSLSKSKTSILQFPYLLLGALAIFFYVGVEVISYDTFTLFGESLGFSTGKAAGFAKFTGYGLLLGYVLGIVCIPRFISQRTALIGSCILSMLFVGAALMTKGMFAVACFAGLGFSNAIMWPAIWPLAIDKLGRFTRKGAALLIMGIVGGAVLPPLYAEFANAIGSRQLGYIIMIPCYLYILYFALAGYKAGKP
jgi:FHS family L-fucose permease-like MFS transporter